LDRTEENVLELKKDYNLIKCPSCGREVKRKNSCPKCGASLGPKGRVSIKNLHISVVIIAIIGIGLLGYGIYEANHIYPISSIKPSMEGKFVTISGIVTDIEYDERYEKTAFRVNDSTGSIEFYGWSDFTSSLRESNKFPSIGDNIIVEGQVDVYNSSYLGLVVSIEVKSSTAFEIKYNTAEFRQISSIMLNDFGKKVVIEGYVTHKSISYSGTQIKYMLLQVTDSSGVIDIFVSGDQIGLAGDLAVFPSESQQVRIFGMVSIYNEEVEIIPSNATEGAIIIL